MTGSIPPVFKNDLKDTFGQYTAEVRWPIILQNCIDDITKRLSNPAGDDENDDGHVLSVQDKQVGEQIKNDLQKLRDQIKNKSHETKVPLFNKDEITKEQDLQVFNDYLNDYNNGKPESQKMTWKNGDWLFTEIYMYRRIHTFFMANESVAPYWCTFDIFNYLKQSTLKSSYFGVHELSKFYLQTIKPNLNKISESELEELYEEFITIALWGNATDLSLLTNATMDDIKAIQGSDSRKKNIEKILVNDSLKSWEYLKQKTASSASASGQKTKVDIVCDNSGFEVFSDLILALFLLDSNLVSTVEFHLKNLPYMVSDVMMKDVDLLLKDFESPVFFSQHSGNENTVDPVLYELSQCIKNHIKSGKIIFNSHRYWTSCADYWTLAPDSTDADGLEMYNYLAKTSSLVIFKGDLNYRKLTGDRQWPRTTSWKQSLGPLGQSKLPVLSLRTCKADVMVALPKGVDEKLCELWAKDNEHGSWWCTSGKWAVICFNA
ncbi:hypothetical protein ACO0RG_001964 [Hanseniaspora osmophila]